jgi:hypothetical protein
MVKLLLGIAALSLILPSIALLYFFSHDPFEFTIPGCVRPDAQDWLAVLFDGCLDPGYVFGFIGSYGMVVFLPLATLIGLLRAIPVRPLN